MLDHNLQAIAVAALVSVIGQMNVPVAAWAVDAQSPADSSATTPRVAPDLGGTSWQLVRFQGGDDETLMPDGNAKYTLVFGNDGSVSVRADCNRGRGTWKSTGANQLEFGLFAMTQAACPPTPLNDRVARSWKYLRSYVIKDGHLFLSLMADGGNFEYEPLGQQQPAASQIKGTATYRERLALPPNAVFEATLEDVSKADAPAQVIGRAHIEQPGNPPIAFEIPYDVASLDAKHRYAVRARILVDGKLWFTTEQNYAVLSAGQSNEVALLLRQAGSVNSAVENTYWKLIGLGDAPVAASSRQQEPHLILDPASRRVSGSGGCNRFTGSYELHGDQLTFGKMASTMMACPEGLDAESMFLAALGRVNQWKFAGEELELSDDAGNLVARFESRNMK